MAIQEMKFGKAEVLRIAAIAQIEVPEEKIGQMIDELNHAAYHANMLSAVDTTGVEQTIHPNAIANVFREDVVVPSYPRDVMVANAANKEAGCYKVPRVVE